MQSDRLVALGKFRSGEVRVLVTSDLTARGIDVATVNLVVNLGLPRDAATYVHRVGRAGRFGSQGASKTGFERFISKSAIAARISVIRSILVFSCTLGHAVSIVRARDQGRVAALEKIQGLRMKRLELPGVESPKSGSDTEGKVDAIALDRLAQSSAPHCSDIPATPLLNNCAAPVETDISDPKTENLPTTARRIAEEVAMYQSWVSHLCQGST